jgi:hypothetical protein
MRSSNLPLNLPGPKSKVVHQGRLDRIFQLSKRQIAEAAWQNAFVDHLLDFGPGKLKRDLL